MNTKRYAAVSIGDGEYAVLDCETEVEMCVVNSYEGEIETPGVRAGKIANALNKAES